MQGLIVNFRQGCVVTADFVLLCRSRRVEIPTLEGSQSRDHVRFFMPRKIRFRALAHHDTTIGSSHSSARHF